MNSDSILFSTLARLNQIGAAINRLGSGDADSIAANLHAIVDSATQVVSGSSAIIYTFDEKRRAFNPESRVAAETTNAHSLPDFPRPDGFGFLAVNRHRRVLSGEEPQVDIHPAKVALGAKSMVAFPLMVGDEILGVLYVYIVEQRSFSELELLMLENLVNQAAMTLSFSQQLWLAQQEQARKERELRRLRRAGMLITSRSSLTGTLEVILSMALEVMDARYGIFRLVDPTGNFLVTQAYAGDTLGKPAVETLPINEKSVMGLTALRLEPVMIADLHASPWNEIYYPLDHELEMRSELAVPLIGASGRLEGVLNLESPNLNAFSRQDRYILQIFATHAVTAIQEARLLDVLQEIASLQLNATLPEVLNALAKHACDLLNVSASQIWLREDEQLVLQATAQTGGCPARLAINVSLAQPAILNQQSKSFKFSDPHPHFPEVPGLENIHSALVTPLLDSSGNSSIGAFIVYNALSGQRDFGQSEWDKKVMNILAHYTALALHNTARQEALRLAQEQHAIAEAFAAVGDTAANLLHSLNNKIGTIPVRIEGIRDKCPQPLKEYPYLNKNLAEIERSAQEAIQVVRENLYHLHPIQLAPVHLDDTIAEALTYGKIPPEIEIHCEHLDELPLVNAGAQRLSLIFYNLIENAIDAMQEHGEIWIQGSADNEWVQVIVRDNGPGIPLELHNRIFEFNYSTHTQERPGKLGFGLWWVKTTMLRFGGTVKIESDGLTGTSFILKLPVMKAEVSQ